MSHRLVKLSAALVVLSLIATIVYATIARSVENPLSFKVVGVEHDAGSEWLSYEVRNRTAFPIDVYMHKSMLHRRVDTALPDFFSLTMLQGNETIPLGGGQSYRGRYVGSTTYLKPDDDFYFNYDWEPLGQVRWRRCCEWLDRHGTILPEAWRKHLLKDSATRSDSVERMRLLLVPNEPHENASPPSAIPGK